VSRGASTGNPRLTAFSRPYAPAWGRPSNILLVDRRTQRDERDEEGHQLKTAVLVGTKDDVPGQQVQRDHVLADRDIVELHLTG
jgi:hypothetical protein